MLNIRKAEAADVPAMLEAVFTIIDAGEAGQQRIEIPPLLMSSR